MPDYNPFTLTFGKEPHLVIGRYEAVDEILSVYKADHSVSQTYLIEGIRGSGKTVLMTDIANRLAEDNSWIVVNLNSTMDLLGDLARGLEKAIRKSPKLLDRGVNISAFGFGVGIDSAAENVNAVSVIENMLDVIKKKKRRLLITIDEVIHNENMKIFASQFQIFLRENYPVYLIMTGLYENIHSIQNDPQLTFLLRSPKVTLPPLGMAAIVREYEDTFHIDEDAAKELAHITKGYAFAFQALGAIYWDYRESLSLGDIIRKLDTLLDDYVYSKIWTSLSAQEKKILLSMEDGEEITAKEIVEKANINESSMSNYRTRLLKKGLISAPTYGHFELALPRFHHVISLYE